MVKDTTTGKSKGYGFISFERKMDADSAMKKMNGECMYHPFKAVFQFVIVWKTDNVVLSRVYHKWKTVKDKLGIAQTLTSISIM